MVQFNPGKLQGGGGSGLGLFISKSIADSHGGCLDVFSEGEGKGCTFTFTLPLYRTGSSPDKENTGAIVETYTPPSSSDQSTSTLDSNAINTMYSTVTTVTPSHKIDDSPVVTRSIIKRSNAAIYKDDDDEGKGQNDDIFEDNFEDIFEDIQSVFNTHSLASIPIPIKKSHVLHILVVDDSKINSKFICKILSKQANWVCDQAEDGQIAVDLVAEKGVHYYDVIFMDYQMPVKNGPIAIKEIRAMNYTGKIIGLTGNALQVDINTMLNAGANKVLVKPADVDELIQIVKDEEDQKN